MDTTTEGVNKMNVLRFLLIATCLLFAACQTAPYEGDLANQTLSVPDTTSLVQSGDMRIGAMDMLDISVFGAPDLDNTYQVDFTGNLKMPLVGSFKAAGFTANELSEVLENKLGERYLQNPEVTVLISKSQDRLLTVDGSVEKPGMYPVNGELSLLQAIALSGGPSDTANPRRVIIFRQIEGVRKAAGYDLTAIREGTEDDPAVFGNDIIVMDGSEARRNYGDFIRSIPLLALFVAL
jgi:polysaccharide export outer membrane protein